MVDVVLEMAMVHRKNHSKRFFLVGKHTRNTHSDFGVTQLPAHHRPASRDRVPELSVYRLIPTYSDKGPAHHLLTSSPAAASIRTAIRCSATFCDEDKHDSSFQLCPGCQQSPDTKAHWIVECPEFNTLREPLLAAKLFPPVLAGPNRLNAKLAGLLENKDSIERIDTFSAKSGSCLT